LIFSHLIRDRASVTRSAAGWDLCLDRMQARLTEAPAAQPSPSLPERYLRYLDQFGFGAFPSFLKQTENRSEGAFNQTPGLETHAFQGPQGSELLLWQATEDADTKAHSHDREAYLLVIEGSYTLALGGAKLTLEAGGEFHFPKGLPIAGSVTRGTRGVLGLGPKRKAEGNEKAKDEEKGSASKRA
jgi:quercetin dioxygenase-like cupin family protein